MTFGCWPHGQAQRILQGRRWWLPPSLGHGEYYESVFAHGFSVHQKCSTYALTNLLFGLCMLIWVIDLLVNLSNPHLGTPTRPSYPWNVVNQGTHPNSFSFRCLHFWTHSWVHHGAWGCVNNFALHGTPHPRRKIKPYTTTLPLYTLCTKLIFQIW